MFCLYCVPLKFIKFPLPLFLVAKDLILKKLQYIVTKEKIQVSLDVLEDIARHADGHMRDAESLLGQVIVIGGKEITAKEADLVIPRSDIGEVVKLINFLTKKDAGSAIDLVNTLIGDGVDIKRFLSDMIEVLRKVMLFKVSPLLSEKIGNRNCYSRIMFG